MPVKTSRKDGHQHLVDLGDSLTSDLKDVADTSPTLNQVLAWDGEQYVPTGQSGGGVWGSITGTLSDQTDLQNALDAKIGTESDPVFGASPAGGITSTQIGNWDTAFSWGDHAAVGYLTSESDPVFGASPAAGITATQIGNWDVAFSWGNHAAVGYLKTVASDDSLTGDGTSGSPLSVASGGGGVAWGSITGTLSDQTDLQNALDAKLGAVASDETLTGDGTNGSPLSVVDGGGGSFEVSNSPDGMTTPVLSSDSGNLVWIDIGSILDLGVFNMSGSVNLNME